MNRSSIGFVALPVVLPRAVKTFLSLSYPACKAVAVVGL